MIADESDADKNDMLMLSLYAKTMTCPNCQKVIHTPIHDISPCPFCGFIIHKSSKPLASEDRSVVVGYTDATKNAATQAHWSHYVRPYIVTGCIALALLGVCIASALTMHRNKSTQTTTSTSKSTSKAETTEKSNSDAVAPATPTTSPTKQSSQGQQIPTPPQCVSASGSPADALQISTASPGLKKVEDKPLYYTVYGYTADQIRTQLNACTIAKAMGAGQYDAITTWWINTAYLYDPTPGGNCYVHNVAVGLHVRQAYPQWQPSPYDTAGLAGKWQTYMSNLKTHEEGHTNLAVQYTNEILSGLQNFPQTNCSTMQQSVGSYVNGKLQALQQASDAYDNQTGHGATQGAVFP